MVKAEASSNPIHLNRKNMRNPLLGLHLAHESYLAQGSDRSERLPLSFEVNFERHTNAKRPPSY